MTLEQLNRARKRMPELLESLSQLLGCTELNMDDMERDTRKAVHVASVLMADIEQGENT